MLVRVQQTATSRGIIAWHDRLASCTLGRGGVRADKREGDGATPSGSFAFRRVLWRADRLGVPVTALTCTAIAPDDG